MECTEVAYLNPNITVESFTKKDGHVVYVFNYQGTTFFYLKTLQLLLEFIELGDFGTYNYPRFDDEEELDRFLNEEVEELEVG